MINVTKHGIILSKRNFAFEAEGVLNPAVIQFEGSIHMFYRAVAKGNRSSIGYCRLEDPLTVIEQYDYPIVVAENDYEAQGVEDPRIVKIEDTFYLSYSGYDGQNAFGCVALSDDLKTFQKLGVIVPKVTGDELRSLLKEKSLNLKYFQPSTGNQYVWDKNLVFFPRKINGKLAFLHRIRPGIQIAFAKDLRDLTTEYWHKYFSEFENHIVLDPKFTHELSYIGGGCPPIETDYGWLLIYHGVHDTINGYEYVACAALLDLDDPTKEIARLPYPLFKPEEKWETEGYVDYVCFPTGSVEVNDVLYIYYGAADERIGVASLSKSCLLEELLKYKV